MIGGHSNMSARAAALAPSETEDAASIRPACLEGAADACSIPHEISTRAVDCM
jgi:hypothetical protein